MNKTGYRISAEDRTIHVLFDVRHDENCTIELTFTENDVLSIINMEALRNAKIPLAGISGIASLTRGKSEARSICLAYKNGSTGEGTVIYPYAILRSLLDEASSELNSSSRQGAA